ncbi:hypothetical protein C9374_010436 [Naegleria lovaniensis]|uniref:tRNA-splicing endonuclease subunit Sen15 domain-containing protein n=1 Tax=Naegleria lovaniensis TaxID=51637 RepID=A0AA88KJA2_NAELO|nr:uncharacterized protein C9374_010436 [Naegleria lovaniensis]KAG2374692.1 hypothetical protein C9374_010436 [Naegleria lovaniensis]
MNNTSEHSSSSNNTSLNFSFETFKNQFNLQSDEQQAYSLYLIYLDIVFVKKIPRQEFNRVLSIHSYSFNHHAPSSSPFTIYYLYALFNIPNMSGINDLSELKSLNDIHCEPKYYVIVPITMSGHSGMMSIRHYHELIESIRKEQQQFEPLDGIVMCFIDGDGTLLYYQMDQRRIDSEGYGRGFSC